MTQVDTAEDHPEFSSSVEQRYLLIMACSARKRLDQGAIPALERYDGGAYRLLRKARREGRCPSGLRVLIVSARYGLIAGDALIEHYEQRMPPEQAGAMREHVLAGIEKYNCLHKPGEAYVDLGLDYFPAVEGLASILTGVHITYACGRIGERLSLLKHWLEDRAVDSGKAHDVGASGT